MLTKDLGSATVVEVVQAVDQCGRCERQKLVFLASWYKYYGRRLEKLSCPCINVPEHYLAHGEQASMIEYMRVLRQQRPGVGHEVLPDEHAVDGL